jgi:hypothetical protein
MDNAPYHSKENNKTPSKYATKTEMITGFRQTAFPQVSTRKTYLYAQITLKKPRDKLSE